MAVNESTITKVCDFNTSKQPVVINGLIIVPVSEFTFLTYNLVSVKIDNESGITGSGSIEPDPDLIT